MEYRSDWQGCWVLVNSSDHRWIDITIADVRDWRCARYLGGAMKYKTSPNTDHKLGPRNPSQSKTLPRWIQLHIAKIAFLGSGVLLITKLVRNLIIKMYHKKKRDEIQANPTKDFPEKWIHGIFVMFLCISSWESQTTLALSLKLHMYHIEAVVKL